MKSNFQVRTCLSLSLVSPTLLPHIPLFSGASRPSRTLFPPCPLAHPSFRFTTQFSNLIGTVYRQGNVLFTPDGNAVLSPVGNRVSVFDLVK